MRVIVEFEKPEECTKCPCNHDGLCSLASKETGVERPFPSWCPLEPREQYAKMSVVEDVTYFECGKWKGLAKTIIREIKEMSSESSNCV